MLPQIIMELIEEVVTFAMVFREMIALWTVKKKSSAFFNLGYFLFGLVVVASEFSFAKDPAILAIHLAAAFMWLIQISLAIPNKLPYDGYSFGQNGKLAKSAAVKIYPPFSRNCVSLINLFGFYLYCQIIIASVCVLIS